MVLASIFYVKSILSINQVKTQAAERSRKCPKQKPNKLVGGGGVLCPHFSLAESLVSSLAAPPPVGGVILDVAVPAPCVSAMSPPVRPSSLITASPPSPSSTCSGVPPLPSVARRRRFISRLLVPVVLRAAADRQRLCHGAGRQVAHLAGLRCPQ